MDKPLNFSLGNSAVKKDSFTLQVKTEVVYNPASSDRICDFCEQENKSTFQKEGTNVDICMDCVRQLFGFIPS